MSNLSDTERQRIEEILQCIQELANMVVEPVDPKVEGCLEIAFTMLTEQLDCDRRYEWGPVPARDDKFLYLSNDKDNEVPGADELDTWLPQEPQDDGEKTD